MNQFLNDVSVASENVALELKDLQNAIFRQQQTWETLQRQRRDADEKAGSANAVFVIECKQIVPTALMPKGFYFDVSDPRPTRPSLPEEKPLDEAPRMEIAELTERGFAIERWNTFGVILFEEEFEQWCARNEFGFPAWRLSPDWLRCRPVRSSGTLTDLLPKAQF